MEFTIDFIFILKIVSIIIGVFCIMIAPFCWLLAGELFSLKNSKLEIFKDRFISVCFLILGLGFLYWSFN